MLNTMFAHCPVSEITILAKVVTGNPSISIKLGNWPVNMTLVSTFYHGSDESPDGRMLADEKIPVIIFCNSMGKAILRWFFHTEDQRNEVLEQLKKDW